MLPHTSSIIHFYNTFKNYEQHTGMDASNNSSSADCDSDIESDTLTCASDDACTTPATTELLSDTNRVKNKLSELLKQSSVFSGAVASRAACTENIKEYTAAQNRLKYRLKNLDRVSKRVRSDIEAYELVIMGLRIKREILQGQTSRRTIPVRGAKQRRSSDSTPSRTTSQSVTDQELWASGGCALQ